MICGSGKSNTPFKHHRHHLDTSMDVAMDVRECHFRIRKLISESNIYDTVQPIWVFVFIILQCVRSLTVSVFASEHSACLIGYTYLYSIVTIYIRMHNGEHILCESFYGRRRVTKICVGKRIDRRTNSDACRIELTVSEFGACVQTRIRTAQSE